MSKLTDMQLVILTQAAQHPRLALTIPPRLKGGAVSKVIGPLLAKGFVEEIEHGPNLPVYRTREDGSRTALLITNAGLVAIGIEPEGPQEEPKPARSRKAGERRGKGTDGATGPKKARKAAQEPATARQGGTRAGTKQAQLIAMLKRPEGATIAQIVEATGWLPHTVRGAMAGALKKRLGLVVSSDTEEGRGRVYRIGN